MKRNRRGVLSYFRHRYTQGRCSKEIVDYVEALLRDPCVYCGELGADTLDHIIPVSKPEEVVGRGGGFGMRHWSNFAPAHKYCNSIRGNGGVLSPLLRMVET